MISINIYLETEVKQLLITTANQQGISLKTLASEIINKAVREQFSIIGNNPINTAIKKPALAGTKPFYFFATPEESGIPLDEWEMKNIILYSQKSLG
jgi:hypothetical protein